jgi:prefoldin subunit 5
LYTRCLKQEVDEVKHQIRIRENRIDKLAAKYDTILKSMGGRLNVEGGGQLPSHAYYLVKLAQEKAELIDKAEQLQKRIAKEEQEIGDLEKAIQLMKTSNFDYRSENVR